MAKRFKGYDKTTYQFIEKVLIACPCCSKKAQVVSPGFGADEGKIESETKLTCIHCGFNKTLGQIPKTRIDWISKYKSYFIRHHIMNTYVDPYFFAPLWLKKELPDGVLWAYNYEHLDFLEKHISAVLRERNIQDITNKSIGSRLPKWMTSKKKIEILLLRSSCN